jgi:hypothetical protein
VVELGESPELAAVREVREERGASTGAAWRVVGAGGLVKVDGCALAFLEELCLAAAWCAPREPVDGGAESGVAAPYGDHGSDAGVGDGAVVELG